MVVELTNLCKMHELLIEGLDFDKNYPDRLPVNINMLTRYDPYKIQQYDVYFQS